MLRVSAAPVLAGLALSLTACGVLDRAPETFTATGTVVNKNDNYSCELSGDQVVIMDADGKDLAIGILGTGDYEFTNAKAICTYQFRVNDLESGHSIYKMTIGSREAPRATEEELRSGISLSLG